MNTSIHNSKTICNSLKKLSTTQKLSSIAHIITIIITIFSFRYKGTTVNFERNRNNHRTTVAYFPIFSTKVNENSDGLATVLKQTVINIIYSESEKSGKPVFIIIDDTIASKLHSIENTYFHQSHPKRKQAHGH